MTFESTAKQTQMQLHFQDQSNISFRKYMIEISQLTYFGVHGTYNYIV